MTEKNPDECCAKFDPKLWEEKEHHWKEKLFIKETLPQIFHMPLPGTIGKMMTIQSKRIEDAHATPETSDFLWLSYDPSPWKAEHFIAVTNEVPEAENVTISGTFISKVFDGPYNNAPKWLKEMQAFMNKEGKTVQKYYFYNTTCPKCAKKYGHNYVVVFAQTA